MSQSKQGPGPLRINARYVHTRRTLSEKLAGHTTSAEWLPEGLSDELDAQRLEMLRLRSAAVVELDALDALETGYRQEDLKHAEKTRDSFASPGGKPAKDARTSPADREASKNAHLERLEALVELMGAQADLIVDTLRESEPALLASLNSKHARQADLVREAMAVVEATKSVDFQLIQQASWLMSTCDSLTSFDRSPAPAAGQKMPRPYVPPPQPFVRHWSKVRPEWAVDAEKHRHAAGQEAARAEQANAPKTRPRDGLVRTDRDRKRVLS